jgi:Mycobacterium membrane protein
MSEETTKRCPFCAETIQAAAIVWRYCGRDLVEKEKPAPHIVKRDAAYSCSECGGYIRPDAEKCKHCGAQSTGAVQVGAALPATKPASVLRVLAILGGIMVVLVGVLILLGGRTGGATSPRTAGGVYTVQYQVQGTAKGASLTYQNAGGDTEQKDVSVPWAVSLTMREGHFVYVLAQNKGETGTITCKILLDGVVVKTAESSGAYKIASCSGKL